MENIINNRINIAKKLENGDRNISIRFIDPKYIFKEDLFLEVNKDFALFDKNTKKIKNLKNSYRNKDLFLYFQNYPSETELIKELKIYNIIFSSIKPVNKYLMFPIMNFYGKGKYFSHITQDLNPESKYILRTFYLDDDAQIRLTKFNKKARLVLNEVRNIIPSLDFKNFNDLLIVEDKIKFYKFDKSQIKDLDLE